MNNREDWWEYTKRIIRSYPALRRKAESVGDIPAHRLTAHPVVTAAAAVRSSVQSLTV